MALHIESGHQVMANAKMIEGDSVRFETEDGRTAFEVRISDGHSIEVRVVMAIKDGSEIYNSPLSVIPLASNAIIVRLVKIEDARDA